MLALALVLDGSSRADAARACCMDRQTLRDWVHRYNADGLANLSDRHGGGTPCLLSAEQEHVITGWIVKGPELTRDGVTRSRQRGAWIGWLVLRSWAEQKIASFPDPGMLVMPFNHNQKRHRHRHIPRTPRRVTNWPAYDASLRQRGSLTVWFTDNAITGWAAAHDAHDARRAAASLGIPRSPS